MTDWQPIETAPKDGTRVLVQLKNQLPVEGRADLDRWNGVPFVASHCGVDCACNGCVVRDLNRAKVLFQMRAISAVLAFPTPTGDFSDDR